MNLDRADPLVAQVLRHTVLRAPALVPEVLVPRVDWESPLWRQGEAGLRALSDTDPFWAFAWEGGTALARHLLDHPELVRGRTVFDFGCGSAIEGVAAMRAGARAVIANDIDPIALAAAALSAEANGVALTINQFSDLRPAFYINSQLGDVSVTNPTGNATPEQILYYTWYEEPEYEVITRSSLMSWAENWPTDTSILTDDELDELAGYLTDISARIRVRYPGSVADVEWKLLPDRRILIKQARPFRER